MSLYAVEVKDLFKVYDAKVHALNGISFKVEEGQAFALLGPNGAGKTTLMRILTTQIKPTSGEAYILGYHVERQSAQVRRLISYVPQEMSVWTDITAYENLLIYAKLFGLPKEKRSKVIDRVLEDMDLKEVKDELVNTFSGGMIRRLEIACAMLIQPKVMFLDEPTIGLDPAARKRVWEKLNQFKNEFGVTIFFNTHYMDEADMYADRVAIINNGCIVVSGTCEELKRSLGGEMIILHLANSYTNLDPLKKVQAVKEVYMQENELRILVDDAEGSLPAIMEFFRDTGISVKRVSVSKPTLEDVFLKYAGTKFESAERISDVRRTRQMFIRT
ncbi:MAG: ATP-binding cassette domain-containing protein [Hydrogenobacter sp.]